MCPIFWVFPISEMFITPATISPRTPNEVLRNPGSEPVGSKPVGRGIVASSLQDKMKCLSTTNSMIEQTRLLLA